MTFSRLKHPSQTPTRRLTLAAMLAAPLVGTLGIASLAALAPTSALAQAFPSKSIRVVLPYSAGSGPDSVLRQVGEKVGKVWGQQVIVDNKPGANGWLAVQDVKRAPADGYTLALVDNTHVALQPYLYKQLPFDWAKDFVPVSTLYNASFFIVVPADSPWKTTTDLINAAKAKNGQMTYGSWGIGSVGHLGAAMLEAESKIPMVHIPFKELPQLYTAVATHDVDWAFGSASSAGALYRSNKVKFLALAAPKRHPDYPDVPTVSESGGPADFELRALVALYAPKGTPPAAVKTINDAVTKALAEQDVKDRLSTVGFVPWIGSPADVDKAMESDSKVFAEVVKRARISLD